MIIRLTNLRSTRSHGERRIHVDVTTDRPPDSARLIVTIAGCDPLPEQEFAVGPDAHRTCILDHRCDGRRMVKVREAASGLETEKYLNLDAVASG